MEKQLNTSSLQEAAEKRGLSQTTIAKALGRYVHEKEPSSGALSTILGVNSVDAKSYLNALRG